MNLDDLPVHSLEAKECAALLRELVAEVKGLRADMRSQSATTSAEDPLLLAILTFVGSLYEFTAGELLDTADEMLRSALGNRNAFALGHELSDLENAVVWGRRLVKKPRGVDGNVWLFVSA